MYLLDFNHLPASFNNVWIKNSDRRGETGEERIVLRNEDDYFVPLARLSSIAIHPLVYYPKLWNEFVNPCKSTSSKILFKKEL
jgi:hypothetical protein